jgi:hypothetical protein
LIVIATLSACSPAGRFLLYIDPYEYEVLHELGIGAATIRQSLPKDLKVRVEVSARLTEEAEALKRLQEVIERAKPGWIYLSSAHPFNPRAVISRYPEVRFFLEGYAGQDSAAQRSTNRIDVVYDREQANYEAGRAIAALLGDADFLRQVGITGAGAVNPRVGILSAVNSEMIQRENASFVEGFSELADPQRISIREIGNLTDRVKARRLLDGMRDETVAIVLLKTYVLSGFCLEYLAKEGGVAVVQGPISDQAYGDTVLLALVDDFIGAMRQMAETMDREVPAGTLERVNAPVRLQWNETYRPAVNRVVEGVDRQ